MSTRRRRDDGAAVGASDVTAPIWRLAKAGGRGVGGRDALKPRAGRARDRVFARVVGGACRLPHGRPAVVVGQLHAARQLHGRRHDEHRSDVPAPPTSLPRLQRHAVSRRRTSGPRAAMREPRASRLQRTAAAHHRADAGAHAQCAVAQLPGELRQSGDAAAASGR